MTPLAILSTQAQDCLDPGLCHVARVHHPQQMSCPSAGKESKESRQGIQHTVPLATLPTQAGGGLTPGITRGLPCVRCTLSLIRFGDHHCKLTEPCQQPPQALPSACMQDLHLSAAITHRLFIQCFIAFRLSPICSKTVLSNICPSTGSSSIFQSPVCTMLPCSLRRMRPQQSGMEWVTLRGEHLQQSGYSQATPKWAAPGIAGYVVREACHFSLDGKGMLFQDLAW